MTACIHGAKNRFETNIGNMAGFRKSFKGRVFKQKIMSDEVLRLYLYARISRFEKAVLTTGIFFKKLFLTTRDEKTGSLRFIQAQDFKDVRKFCINGEKSYHTTSFPFVSEDCIQTIMELEKEIHISSCTAAKLNKLIANLNALEVEAPTKENCEKTEFINKQLSSEFSKFI